MREPASLSDQPVRTPVARRSRVARAATGPRPDGSRAGAAPGSAQAFVDAHQDQGTADLFGIAELCTEFGVTLRALRFYEDKGLLTPRRVSGARVYSRRDRARLSLILRAKAIGTSLSEIKHYLDLYGDNGEGRIKQLGYVIERTDDAIRELETRRARIDETLAELRLINANCRRQLAQRRRPA